MGHCMSQQRNELEENAIIKKQQQDYLPLFCLKQELLENIGVDDNHHFKIFCTWRFINSVRNDKEFIENIKRIRASQVGDNYEKMAAIAEPKKPKKENFLDILSNNTITASKSALQKAKKLTSTDSQSELPTGQTIDFMELKSTDSIYNEDPNILVATWFNNLGLAEKPFEEKWLFYNSESLLNKQDILEHFREDNNKIFSDKSVEFLSRKGNQDDKNKDNFFVIVQGKVKIMGIFDGHGLNGNLASSFVMGHMMDYLKHSKRFQKNIEELDDQEIETGMRKCFRYAQDKIKQQYRDFLLRKQSRKHEAKTKQENKKKQNGSDQVINQTQSSVNQIGEVRNAFSKSEEQEFFEEQIIGDDEQEFIDNVSWDTNSNESEIDNDDRLVNEFGKLSKVPNLKKAKTNQSINVSDSNETLIQVDQQLQDAVNPDEFFDYYFHDFKKKYTQITPQYDNYRQKQKQKKQGQQSCGTISDDEDQDEEEYADDNSNNSCSNSYNRELCELDEFEEHKIQYDFKKHQQIEKKRMQANSNSEEVNNNQNQIIDIEENNKIGDDLQDDPITKITRQRQRDQIKIRSDDEWLFDILLSGCTATLVIHIDNDPKRIYVCWVGDSLFTMCSKTNIPKPNFNDINLIHQPKNPKEKYRIYNSRGEIRETRDGNERVFLRARMYPAIKITRSIGDLIAHQVGVTSEPDFLKIDVTQHDKYFIMATDGLWEYFTQQELLDFIGTQHHSVREVYGKTSEIIYNKLRDMVSSCASQTIKDTTFIMSFLNS